MHSFYSVLDIYRESRFKNDSYLKEIGSESKNKWVVDFVVQSKLPGEIPC